MRYGNWMTMLFSQNSIMIINHVVIYMWSSSRLHIDSFLGWVCKSHLRICFTEGLGIIGIDTRSISRSNPIRLFLTLGTKMCRAPNYTSINKGSLSKVRTNGASSFSLIGWIFLNLGMYFGYSIGHSRRDSPFLYISWLFLNSSRYFSQPISLTTFLIFILWCKGLAISRISWNHFCLLSLSIIWMLVASFIIFLSLEIGFFFLFPSTNTT